MDLIIKLLKLKIVKALFFLLFICFIASLYFYKDWYIRQYHKCVGFYYVNKGDKAFKKRNYQKAIDYYRAGLRQYPEHSNASCNLGSIYVSYENYTEAVNSYKNALKHKPDYMFCRMDLGIILAEKMASYDKAIQEYGRITSTSPKIITIPLVYSNRKTTNLNRGIAYYNMGLAYRGKSVFMGDRKSLSVKYLQKARDSYIKAQKYLKKDYDNTYNLALTNHLLGDYNNAAKDYCRAININPMKYEAHYNYAILLRAMNRNRESLEEFEKTTLLLDLEGKQERSKYVFGIIRDINRRILNEGNYEYLKNRVDLTSLPKDEIVYHKGKVLYDKQKDYDMNKLLRCKYNKEFEEP